MTLNSWLPAGTPKIVYTLQGALAGLDDAGLRERLAAAGVRRLQLNLDDAPVAAAMRIPTGEPMTGFVSVWTDSPAETGPAVADLLRDCAAAVHGYLVDERRRMDPPETYDGQRADALANVAVLRRPAELSQAEWLQVWLVRHTPIAVRTQATFGYVQNIVLDPVTPDAPRVDAFVEELFPSAGITDMHAFYGSGGDDAELGRRLGELMESVARIGADRDLDLVPTSRYLWDLEDL